MSGSLAAAERMRWIESGVSEVLGQAGRAGRVPHGAAGGSLTAAERRMVDRVRCFSGVIGQAGRLPHGAGGGSLAAAERMRWIESGVSEVLGQAATETVGTRKEMEITAGGTPAPRGRRRFQLIRLLTSGWLTLEIDWRHNDFMRQARAVLCCAKHSDPADLLQRRRAKDAS
jgi:hypothetical protein